MYRLPAAREHHMARQQRGQAESRHLETVKKPKNLAKSQNSCSWRRGRPAGCSACLEMSGETIKLNHVETVHHTSDEFKSKGLEEAVKMHHIESPEEKKDPRRTLWQEEQGEQGRQGLIATAAHPLPTVLPRARGAMMVAART